MKQNIFTPLVIAFLTLTSFNSNGQEQKNPTFYLNSEVVEMNKLYLNPNSIDSIKVKKQTKDGEIYIYTKCKNLIFVSINDILKDHNVINSLTGADLIKINGKVINDTTDIRIDYSYFIYVETNKLTDTQYLADKFRDLVIVDIYLETVERKPKILLRGNNEFLPYEIEE